ncbi:hypothetical protein [Halococcus saccharolyticus]|uniref:hypothetical protein n=1 Tax=Halococcus saccharolyticus TaxID=62319 RepID=UPI0012673D5E|nr:hypothetical protein [Halococcus saccharolyticus]
MSLLSSIVSGAIAGFLATSLGSLTVRWWQKPVLEFEPSILRNGHTSQGWLMEWCKYEVEVRNTGSSVATNCKLRVILEGVRNTTETRIRQDAQEGGAREQEVSAEKNYQIELTQGWSESESPTRIDINREEISRFELFRVHSEAAGPEMDTRIVFSEHEQIDGGGGNLSRHSEPIRVETYTPRTSYEPFVDMKSQLKKETFEEIEWNTKKVIVTSADANKLEGELDVTWEDSPLPDVNLKPE